MNEELKQRLDQKAKELCKKYTVRGEVPFHHAFRGMSGSFNFGGASPEPIPYEEARVADRAYDSNTNRAAYLIEAQIDHRAGMGAQYGWYGVIIDQELQANEVYRDNAWDDEYGNGKRPKKAKDLLEIVNE